MIAVSRPKQPLTFLLNVQVLATTLYSITYKRKYIQFYEITFIQNLLLRKKGCKTYLQFTIFRTQNLLSLFH